MNRGRLRSRLEITEVGELTRDDLALLRVKRTTPVVNRFRDPHHRVARLLAAGLRPKDVAEQCGFTIARIYVLNADPSFQDLIAGYRRDVADAYVSAEEERFRMATEVNLKALRTINEHFDKADEEGELVPLSRALAVFADTSDRVGIMKKSVSMNVNVDFAAKLEAARNRSGKVIEGRALPAPSPREHGAMGEVAKSVQPHASPSLAPGSSGIVEGVIARRV